MTEIVFYARGDSSTANNASINTQSLIATPVAELRFVSTADGDIILDYNDGLSDPDTLLYVNGSTEPTTFTVEFTGTLPISSRYADVNGIDLRGADLIVITDDTTGQRYWFITETQLDEATVAALPNGATSVANVNENPPPVVICFASGVEIDTPDGPRLVENLAAGDVVSTDVGPRPLVWVGRRHVKLGELFLEPMLRPVEIRRNAFGPGLPKSSVIVSANHRIRLTGWQIALSTGGDHALIAAKHLVDGNAVRRTLPRDGVTYHHLMFDSHRLVTSHGLVSESFDPGPVGLATLTPENRRAVEALMIGWDREPAHDTPSLRKHEAAALREIGLGT